MLHLSRIWKITHLIDFDRLSASTCNFKYYCKALVSVKVEYYYFLSDTKIKNKHLNWASTQVTHMQSMEVEYGLDQNLDL